MALQFRRGSAAIQEAAARKGGSGDSRPFLPQITWRNDQESKYVLVLTDIEDVYTVLLHTFIPVSTGVRADGEAFTRWEDFLSRRDAGIGEDYDDLEDRLERDPKTRAMGVMVELEAVLEGGTKKVKGFRAKTETITRNREDGKVEVTVPSIGICTQSPVTLWGSLESLYQSLGALVELPVQITRRGKDTNTRYDTIPFLEKPVDLSPLIEHMHNIAYVGEYVDELTRRVDAEDGDVAKAQAIADFLLLKRIDELGDAERYAALVGPLTIEDMPKTSWGRKQSAKSNGHPARPVRRSPREESHSEEPSEESSAKESSAKESSAKDESFQDLKRRIEARG